MKADPKIKFVCKAFAIALLLWSSAFCSAMLRLVVRENAGKRTGIRRE